MADRSLGLLSPLIQSYQENIDKTGIPAFAQRAQLEWDRGPVAAAARTYGDAYNQYVAPPLERGRKAYADSFNRFVAGPLERGWNMGPGLFIDRYEAPARQAWDNGLGLLANRSRDEINRLVEQALKSGLGPALDDMESKRQALTDRVRRELFGASAE